jgi:hypothetical protein
MTEGRKYIRIVIPADKIDLFNKAKRSAEDNAMVKLSDTQYATRLLQWALEHSDK